MFHRTSRLVLLATALAVAAFVATSKIGSAEQAGATAVERPNAPPAQTTQTVPDGLGCNSVAKPPNAGGASLERAAGQGLQQKNWQAPGGEVQFNIKSFARIPPSAAVVVCFRWKGNDAAEYFPVRPHLLDLSADGKILKVTARVPAQRDMKGVKKDYTLFVPLAEVRVLAIPPAGAVDTDGKQFERADASTRIGITSVPWALLLVIVVVLLAYGILTLVGRSRMRLTGVSIFNPIGIITLPSGYASLSQFQIIIWTFVVGASAVYVMALSGELIEVTSGTLVLLGISGAAAIGAKWHNEATGASTPQTLAAPPAPVAEPAPVVAPAPVPGPGPGPVAEPAPVPAPAAAPAGAVIRRPRWSDLVINEVVENGVVKRREIDVSRVQMLYFTLITASFAVLKVLTTYVIPEIPDGFQVLLGISNAVYMGSKVAQKPADGKPQ